MLEVTPIAVDKIKEVLENEKSSEAALRVIALPGQNGGVQYMLSLEDKTQGDDLTLDRGGIKFLVDSDSAPFLEDATIDFVEDLTRVGFVISNPKFSSGGCGAGCGCGNGGGGCGCGAQH